LGSTIGQLPVQLLIVVVSKQVNDGGVPSTPKGMMIFDPTAPMLGDGKSSTGSGALRPTEKGWSGHALNVVKLKHIIVFVVVKSAGESVGAYSET